MKVLIAPTSFGECGPEPVDLLRSHGFELVLNPFRRRLTAEEVVELGEGCVGIVAGVEPLTAEIMRQLPALRCISRCGVGLENVDLEAAGARGIAVRNTPDGPTRAVAELTIGLAIALLRRICAADRNMRKGAWKKEIGNLLLGKTVGIVGLGRIGRAVGELFLCIGCNVCATDPVPNSQWLSRHKVDVLPLEDLVVRSDIVSLHLALETAGQPILGKLEFAKMKRSAVLLNLARADAVDETALYGALREGRIAGAALDVFSSEPYSGPLLELENVIATPHLGSYAHEAKLRMEVLSARNLLEGLSENRPSAG